MYLDVEFEKLSKWEMGFDDVSGAEIHCENIENAVFDEEVARHLDERDLGKVNTLVTRVEIIPFLKVSTR
jgi:hypothetical protein